MSENKKAETTFWQHLMELLYGLRKILYSLIISTIIAMVTPISLDFLRPSPSKPFYLTITSFVIKDLQNRFLTEEVELLPVTFLAPPEVYMQISFVIGIIMSLPVISQGIILPPLVTRSIPMIFGSSSPPANLSVILLRSLSCSFSGTRCNWLNPLSTSCIVYPKSSVCA